jgi:DNA-binding response OmpR family regulator/glycine cleavage system H lipoate-binding protein
VKAKQKDEKRSAEARRVFRQDFQSRGGQTTARRKEEPMKTQTRDLLVVDDEQVVCDSCARILGEKGFRVQTETNPSKALRMATEKEYAVILLDIKMPAIDGFEFIKELKKKHKDVRVVMITGYPSTENFATAGQLGAVDFIPKPFSPDELLDAVAKVMPAEEKRVETEVAERVEAPAAIERAPQPVEGEPATEYITRYRFMDEVWVKLDDYGVARVGAFLSSDEAREIADVHLPEVGDVVYRGLPLASFGINGRPQRIVPSPVTGEIVETNTALIEDKPGIWHHPCREGWIARIRPENAQEEIAECRTRHVIVAMDNEALGRRQARELGTLGCSAAVAVSPGTTLEAINRNQSGLVLVDAASFGNDGPKMVGWINEKFAEAKVVVVADPDSRWEAEYRAHKIFYYAVKPLTNAELIDILNSAFGATIEPAPEMAASGKLPTSVSKVTITNRYSQEVNLLVSGEALLNNKGVGLQLRNLIFSENYPITFTLGTRHFEAIDLMREANLCDRILILEARDTGKVPGSVTVVDGCEALRGVGGSEYGIKTLVIQPNGEQKGALVFDARTSRAVAEFIMNKMASK